MEIVNKVTRDHIASRISKVEYHHLTGTTMTICVITMENGFAVTGESACVDPASFDKDIGETIAYDNAFDKLWALEGYLLKERIHQSLVPTVDVVT
jgi:hypothetical protein